MAVFFLIQPWMVPQVGAPQPIPNALAWQPVVAGVPPPLALSGPPRPTWTKPKLKRIWRIRYPPTEHRRNARRSYQCVGQTKTGRRCRGRCKAPPAGQDADAWIDYVLHFPINGMAPLPPGGMHYHLFRPYLAIANMLQCGKHKSFQTTFDLAGTMKIAVGNQYGALDPIHNYI
jgi:hypothetical protein